MDASQLTEKEFREFKTYLQQIAGIHLGDNKQYLVATRLRRVFLEYDCKSLAELTRFIRLPSNSSARQKVIDVMTTNETLWFRDKYPFDYLKSTILPELHAKQPNGRFRIWSAACSSGQEPYSLSMIIEECQRENSAINRLNVEIVATDLSSLVLEKAKAGVFDRLSINRGLADQRLRTYFEPAGGELWRAGAQIRNRISFRPLNLQDSYTALGKFDIIYCRNVLIYFTAELKKDILRRLHASLKPGGFLFLGSSESLSIVSDLFEMVHCNPGVMYRAK